MWRKKFSVISLFVCIFLLEESASKSICIREGSWPADISERCHEQNTTAPCTDEYPKSGLSTKVLFEHEGVDVSYASRFESGTIAKISCAHGFTRSENFKDLLECTTDGWMGVREPCKMKCDATIDEENKFPWHVNIYKRVPNGFENICGGTLISPRLILTDARCFVSERATAVAIDTNEFVVTAGKSYRKFYSDQESHFIMRRIKDIWMSDSNSENIAVLKLAKFIPFSKKIQPICLYNDDDEVSALAAGQMPVWQTTSLATTTTTIESLAMSRLTTEQCNSIMTPDNARPSKFKKLQFCLSSVKALLNCTNHLGSGFVVKLPNTNHYRLVGIVNAAPFKLMDCGRHNFVIATDIGKYREIIENFLQHDLDDDDVDSDQMLVPPTKTKHYLKCKIPADKMFMRFKDNKSLATYQAGQEVAALTTLKLSCNSDLIVGSDDDTLSCRKDGSWSAEFPRCEIGCGNHHPEHDPTTIFDLEFNGKIIDNHTVALRAGTKAKLQCAPGYEKPNGHFTEISTCTVVYGWTPKRTPCVKDCRDGVENIFQPHEDDQTKANNWHVGIFFKAEFPANYLCGGNLISPRVLVTASSCFMSSKFDLPLDTNQLIVAAGNYPQDFSEFASIDKSKLQTRSIKQIWNQADFYDFDSVAVIQINEPFQFPNIFNPLCINYDEIPDLPMDEKTVGHMFAWNLKKNFDKPLYSLEARKLTTMSRNECNALLADCSVSLKPDQFCLKPNNEDDAYLLHRFESGQGFRFETNNPDVYALAGICLTNQPENCKHNVLIMIDLFYYRNTIDALLDDERKAGYAH